MSQEYKATLTLIKAKVEHASNIIGQKMATLLNLFLCMPLVEIVTEYTDTICKHGISEIICCRCMSYCFHENDDIFECRRSSGPCGTAIFQCMGVVVPDAWVGLSSYPSLNNKPISFEFEEVIAAINILSWKKLCYYMGYATEANEIKTFLTRLQKRVIIPSTECLFNGPCSCDYSYSQDYSMLKHRYCTSSSAKLVEAIAGLESRLRCKMEWFNEGYNYIVNTLADKKIDAYATGVILTILM